MRTPKKTAEAVFSQVLRYPMHLRLHSMGRLALGTLAMRGARLRHL